MDKVHTEQLRGYTINIYQDPEPMSPEESADERAFLVYEHSQFTVYGPNKETARQVFENKNKWEKTHRVLIVYAYIHSGVRLGLSTAGMVDVQWDVSTTGFLLITKDRKEIPDPDKYAHGMIDEWNQYLSGDVYGYQVVRDDGDSETDAHIDSCWGFYDLDECKRQALNAVPVAAAAAPSPALPPDPDEQNNDRSKWADAVVRAFIAATKTDPEDALYDLLCDLMHWADRHPEHGTFDGQMCRALAMYNEETAEVPR